MSLEGIGVSDIAHLEAIEAKPFHPTGWLYTNIYRGLVERRLARQVAGWGFEITDAGRALLTGYRLGKAAR